jgi:hypothetical protein
VKEELTTGILWTGTAHRISPGKSAFYAFKQFFFHRAVVVSIGYERTFSIYTGTPDPQSH